MLGEMVATIAHEINQPLAAIAANCDAARRWFDKDPPDLVEIRAALDRVTRDQRWVSEVITRLRSFTRAGDSLFHEVQINGAVLEVLTILSAELRTSEILVRPVLAANLPMVMGDRIQLQQVLINLALNARDAMKEVYDRPRRLMLTTSLTADGWVSVRVEDTGVGFAPGVADRVFEKMFTTKADGSGLGLAICQNIIQAHGGSISVANGANGGAQFEIRLPPAAG